MAPRYVIALLVIVGLVFYSCGLTTSLSEDELYKTVNEIIATDSLHIFRACSKFQKFDLQGKYWKEFTTSDKLFYLRYSSTIDGVIKPNKLRYYKIRNGSLEYTKVDTACHTGLLYHISLPIISTDRKKILIEFDQDCNCMLGGEGGKRLYIKTKGRWKLVKQYDQWISKTNKTYKGSFFAINSSDRKHHLHPLSPRW